VTSTSIAIDEASRVREDLISRGRARVEKEQTTRRGKWIIDRGRA